jgi:D-xylose transport system substrate-binding protein
MKLPRVLAAAAVVALLATACGGDEEPTAEETGAAAAETETGGVAGEATEATETGTGGGEGATIALLLPESKTARFETQDRPSFEGKVAELCPECEIVYSNANQDASQQQQQVEAALAQDVDVLVLDPVDSAAAAVLVDAAKAQDVPVISYDRLITDADVDYYISFDNEEVGRLQGQALLDRLTADGNADGTIVMINGAPTDNNATLFKQGAHSVLDESGLTIAQEYDTPDWSPDEAQREMDQAITAVGAENIDGVYAANDGTAGGAIAAMKAAGISPLPPVTGQDAELAAIQRILAGEQYMTVYKAITPEAEAAAELAVALARGEDPPSGLVTGSVDNGMKDVESVLLTPIAVTIDNIQDTIVADEFWSVEEICTAEYQQFCADAGIE